MLLTIGIIVGALLIFLLLAKQLLGIVMVKETEVGIVIKRFGKGNLPEGHLVALNGEAGIQADTLPPGWHLWKFPWQYSINIVPAVQIEQGALACIVAKDGNTVPNERIVAKEVECSNFQDARKFLMNGGEKGRQSAILTSGTYRLNTALFTVITQDNAENYDMKPSQLSVYSVLPGKVGIVTTLDGQSIAQGEIAGPIVTDHNNFQNVQAFINNGGCKGLQEQVLLSGSWNLNPWFASVKQVDMTEVPIGHVGVIISFVGKPAEDISGDDFKHGALVPVGHKGVWMAPIFPGKHPINTDVMNVELVPTTNIVLNWAERTEAHTFDEKLNTITVRSKDGFSFNLDVAQVIHVGANEAPKVISRVGTMQNLVDHVLEPVVGNYFRNSAQNYTVLDFLCDREERQKEAAAYISAETDKYNVIGVDTLIGDIDPPAQLMQTQTDRKIAEEQEATYKVQESAQKQRQTLVRETSIADIQDRIVTSEQNVNIAELDAKASVKKTEGDATSKKLMAEAEATAIKSIGNAQGEAYKAQVDALGSEQFTFMHVMDNVAMKGLRIVPDIMVSGSTGGGIGEALLGMLMRQNGERKIDIIHKKDDVNAVADSKLLVG